MLKKCSIEFICGEYRIQRVWSFAHKGLHSSAFAAFELFPKELYLFMTLKSRCAVHLWANASQQIAIVIKSVRRAPPTGDYKHL